jgi:hypothetical protein
LPAQNIPTSCDQNLPSTSSRDEDIINSDLPASASNLFETGSAMHKLAELFLKSSQVHDDAEFGDACNYVSNVGQSMIPDQNPNFQKTSRCVTTDFLSSFLTLVIAFC